MGVSKENRAAARKFGREASGYLASAEQRYKAEEFEGPRALIVDSHPNRFSSPPTSNTETTSRSSLLVSTCSMGPWASSTNSNPSLSNG